ncbi:choice-of-anchor A family protein [Neiella sp. HB171785]|uniref:Choice-of-anchor A family protein n=1 Tax=Neiella litorisoli TaxID=2771431 RepID=A0A8J6UDX1_9GAMM|nr:choice-of-anchor A family protein [Neiella litorisoli]MBD1388739.1 choice-of-anchor A family protein [Neiella litorisoli]
MFKHAVRRAVAIVSLFLCNTSWALPITDYNFVVLNDFTGSVHVQGSTFIGGNLNITSASDFGYDANLAGSAALSVVDDIFGNGVKVLNGDVVYGGDLTNPANIATNNGTVYQDKNLAVSQLTAQLEAASVSYDNLTANGSITGDMNGRTFSYSGSEQVAVFDINASLFQQSNGMQFDLGLAEKAVINVSGSSANIHSALNFRAINNSIYYKILWNFIDTTEINFNNKFIGSVLATKADIFNGGFDMDGAVIARNYSNQSLNEIHNYIYQGVDPIIEVPSSSVEVPEPQTPALILFGALLLTLMKVQKRRF